MERSGAVDGGRRRWVGGQFTLPAEGIEIPIGGEAGHVLGRYVLMPDWDVGVSLEARVAAIALVDLVGGAFATQQAAETRNEARVGSRGSAASNELARAADPPRPNPRDPSPRDPALATPSPGAAAAPRRRRRRRTLRRC